MELNVPVSVYRQPFETVAVVFPDGLFPRPISADVGRPPAIAGRFAPERFRCLSVLMAGDGEHELHGRYDFADAAEGQLIESYLGECPTLPGVIDDERGALAHALRIFINANLLCMRRTPVNAASWG